MEHGKEHAEGYNAAMNLWDSGKGGWGDPMALTNPYEYGTERWNGFEEAVADLCDQLEG